MSFYCFVKRNVFFLVFQKITFRFLRYTHFVLPCLDTKLVTLYKEGKSVNELTNIFLRNSGAIKARLLKLLGIDLDK